MEPNTHNHQIQKNVTDAIQSGKVTMRSSLHFIFKTVLLIGALFGVLILSTIILNFILFSIHIQSHHELLGFGILGILAFLNHFPWFFFFIDCAHIVAVIYLVRSFRFGYKVPTLYLGLGLLAAVALLSFVTERTGRPMNERIMYRIEQGGLPSPLPRVVGGIKSEPPQKRPLCRCEVLALEENGVLVTRDTRSGMKLIFTLEPFSSYATTSGLSVGDIILIAGSYDGDNDADDRIPAFGIKRIRE